MTKQLTLGRFYGARHADPESSHAAARELVKSGRGLAQRAEVLEALTRYGSCTSRELAFKSGLDRYTIARRLPELERSHVVYKSGQRQCSTNGRLAVVWEVT